VDQELADATADAACALRKGSTFLREMTSRPPSWKCDPIQNDRALCFFEEARQQEQLGQLSLPSRWSR